GGRPRPRQRRGRSRPHARAAARGRQAAPRHPCHRQRGRPRGDRDRGRPRTGEAEGRLTVRLVNAALVILALLATLGGYLQEKKRLETIAALPPAEARAL